MPHLIMVVDDDCDIREALSELLEEEGHQVVLATNGEQALALLEGESKPSLILLDLMMPLMNGYEFREEQKKDPALAAIPIVVITAGTLDSRSNLDPVAVCQKPLERQELVAIIDQYCQP